MLSQSPGESVGLDRPADPTTSPTASAAHQNMLSQSPGEPVGLDRPADPPTSPTAALGRLTPPSPDNGNQEIPIDPALLIEPESRIPGPATVEATEIEGDDGRPNHTLNGLRKSAGGRLTAAEKAERNGLVEGVKRGNLAFSIARQNRTQQVLSHAASATTRYNRKLPLIISRAERLAIETDAYILLLAQQTTGSSATVHFTSERLRREAFDESGNLINQFQELMTHLVKAKRSMALALAQNLDTSEKVRIAVMERLEDREAELAASRRANEELMAELEAIRNARGLRNE
ncbi:hypothetical protein AGABI2DRAFT_120581 [Agaricus bisporus var. bisporus H97]|uniref:hypothetical protein n=1 Tax=Agaricus bisporus var. bisporus (strain H97 / ATCC MYA-4626 / FGSC 10389) TaxID=936046 RepID=UPI00029F6034|nr:hypothetical protein AGABI2DRAFT_120581 [Agaricus bisporus var. bisporus H97]EKV44454.1 hypothetical protein AGABI2DRAFT_120581 [Agaricus bisporus var. bisporus H97]